MSAFSIQGKPCWYLDFDKQFRMLNKCARLYVYEGKALYVAMALVLVLLVLGQAGELKLEIRGHLGDV